MRLFSEYIAVALMVLIPSIAAFNVTKMALEALLFGDEENESIDEKNFEIGEDAD